ncbi:GNAT family N-acetyltransferase [bacterium]|nr:GNAT family N-acetyltransferase [bacterium]
MRWQKDKYLIDDDPSSINLEVVVELLRKSHWAKHRTADTVKRSILNSLCFGLYNGDSQIGFARVLTDYATYAIILDMIIAEEFRGKGLGNWLMEVVTNHFSINNTRQMLWTSTAQGLYEKSGFTQLGGKPVVMAKPPFP